MSPGAAAADEPAAPARSRFVGALPWSVVAAALVTLTPTVLLPDILVAHLPTFIVLLTYAMALASRSRKGQTVSPVAIAAVVGGLGASTALMLLPALGVLEDPTTAMFYFATWWILPPFALLGSGLAAAGVGLGRLLFRRTSKV